MQLFDAKGFFGPHCHISHERYDHPSSRALQLGRELGTQFGPADGPRLQHLRRRAHVSLRTRL